MKDLNPVQTGTKPETTTPSSTASEGPSRVNGFEQVLEMLRIADSEFRESLLRRLSARDPKLAASLRKQLFERHR